MTARAILLVEDNPDEVDLVREAFAGLDAAIGVRVACDVDQACQLLADTAEADLPALVVTDHHLPGACGQDLIARLRDCPRLATLPVVMVSGDAARPDGLEAIAWFAKPDTWSGWCALARDLAKHLDG